MIKVERCYYIMTAGMYPWRLEASKKCVTTYQPNVVALKMDGS